MSDQEMIERVAKAIHDEHDFPGITYYHRVAIAAIKAMRKPTKKMFHVCHPLEADDVKYIWRSLIDAILND